LSLLGNNHMVISVPHPNAKVAYQSRRVHMCCMCQNFCVWVPIILNVVF